MINCMSLGMSPLVEGLPWDEGEAVSVRGRLSTIRLITHSRRACSRWPPPTARRPFGGLGLTWRRQGALAFQLWTGADAPVAVMRAAAEKHSPGRQREAAAEPAKQRNCRWLRGGMTLGERLACALGCGRALRRGRASSQSWGRSVSRATTPRWFIQVEGEKQRRQQVHEQHVRHRTVDHGQIEDADQARLQPG